MHRRVTPFLAFAALAAVACQDVQDPRASFQVRDKVHNPDNLPQYDYLFFEPPIVPSPTFPAGATFDEGLLPYLTVRVTALGPAQPNLDGDLDAPPNSTCSDNAPALSGLSVDPASGRYSVGWQTKKKGSPSDPSVVTPYDVYRICVYVDPPELGASVANPRVIGFRDVMPDSGGADTPRNTAQNPTYQFGWGSNVAVKFRILDGLLSADLCTAGVLGADYDCTAQFLNSGETAVCDETTCAFTTGGMLEPELFLIEKFGVVDDECFVGPPAGVRLDIDNPQYPGCVRLTVFDFDGSFDGFRPTDDQGNVLGAAFGTVAACFYAPQLGADQREAVQLHIQYPPEAGSRRWALPWAETSDELDFVCDQLLLAGTSSDRFSTLAARTRKLLRGAQQLVNPWFAPPAAHAFHTGFGGHTSLKSTEITSDGSTLGLQAASLSTSGGSVGVTQVETVASLCEGGSCPPQVFRLAWALPSAMDSTDFCTFQGPGGCEGLPSASLLTASLEDSVRVRVQVWDNGANDNDPRTLGAQRPVEGALVHFAVNGTPADAVLSSAQGYAEFRWQLTETGTTTITAYGFGIGTEATGGPFDSFDRTVDPPVYSSLATELTTGTLTFQVEVCPRAPDANGAIDHEAFYDGKTWTDVLVNLGGSVTGTAKVLVANDCDDLYIAFAVPATVTNTTSLRFVFDNVWGNGESADDDILSLTLDGSGVLRPLDRYLSAGCIGSKQADCGPLDTNGQQIEGGAGSISDGSAIGLSGSWFLYELKHPLAGDGAQDLNRPNNGDMLGYYLALYLGNGSKANAEWPDQRGSFKRYQPYTITY